MKLYINFHVFSSGGQFISSRLSFFTSSYNFEVNRHEKVGQKREKARAPKSRGGKNWWLEKEISSENFLFPEKEISNENFLFPEKGILTIVRIPLFRKRGILTIMRIPLFRKKGILTIMRIPLFRKRGIPIFLRKSFTQFFLLQIWS